MLLRGSDGKVTVHCVSIVDTFDALTKLAPLKGCKFEVKIEVNSYPVLRLVDNNQRMKRLLMKLESGTELTMSVVQPVSRVGDSNTSSSSSSSTFKNTNTFSTTVITPVSGSTLCSGVINVLPTSFSLVLSPVPAGENSTGLIDVTSCA